MSINIEISAFESPICWAKTGPMPTNALADNPTTNTPAILRGEIKTEASLA